MIRHPLQRALLLLLLCAAVPAAAHRAPGSVSTIEYNRHTGMLEVVHRLHLHDAEIGVAAALDEPSLSLSKLESRAKVALYVAERFEIRSEGAELGLALVGAEITGDYLFVYQERRGELPQLIAVRDDILRDAFPAQINQVNISDGERVRTLSFTGDDRWHEFEFGAASE
jgi:Domain of unknown function (DUF6702)